VGAPPDSSAGAPATRAERAVDAVRILSREPRTAGGEAEARARAYCAERLRSAGFEVREESFEYSAFVGRWGTAIGGLVAFAVVASGATAARHDRPGIALLVLTLGAGLLAAVARVLARDGVVSFPALRCRGVNLIARRRADVAGLDAAGAREPTLWLMAHLDSKSQPVPILARAAGITVVGVVWVLALGLALVQWLGVAPMPAAWVAVSVAAAVGAVPVVATMVGVRSPGALDNATGVATVLAAAEDAHGTHFAVCLTSAEELGLAGARAWVAGAGRPRSVAVNCDTVDDTGATTCMYSGRRPASLVAAVLATGSRAGAAIRAHRLLPGVLTDGVALGDAGWDVVTLSKGGVRTLARIHTPRDTADHLTGAGMDEVARVLVALIETRA